MGVGAVLYMYDVVVKAFTFAISTTDEFLFAISCTRYCVPRPLGSHLTLNDARRRYFRFCRNRK